VNGDGMQIIGTAWHRATWLVTLAIALSIVTTAVAGAGDRSGIALFPPPGTDPVKRGIVVPEDFPLPDGYVRHYQTTDDGKRLPAILMFRPDYVPVDDQGRLLELPKDGIVSPEMAPAGLPIKMLDVPAARGSPGPTS
jgi:hypothetical protein